MTRSHKRRNILVYNKKEWQENKNVSYIYVCINQVTPQNHPDLLDDQHNHLELNEASNKRSDSHGKDRSVVSNGRSRDKTNRRSRCGSRSRRRSNQR